MRYQHAWASAALVMTVCASAWSAPYSTRTVVFPAGSVLKVRMDDTISSERSQRGDRFTATVADDATYDLPAGTRVEGVVTGVTRANEERPGMMDVEFRTLRLPDGQSYRIDGTLTSLDARSVQRASDGRLVSRASSKNQSRFIAYGAGAGFLIGSLLGENVAGTLLGAAAGYLYGQQQKSKANGREVVVRQGTEFGVRLDQRLALAPTYNSRDSRPRVGGYRSDTQPRNGSYRSNVPSRDERYGSDYRYREERYSSTDRYGRDRDLRVMVNDQAVRFASARPFRSGGQVMVPVAPVLDAARVAYRYDRYNRELTMDRPREVQLVVGSSTAMIDGRRVHLGAPARVIDGSLYVPADFFRHAADMELRWDDADGTLVLTDAR